MNVSRIGKFGIQQCVLLPFQNFNPRLLATTSTFGWIGHGPCKYIFEQTCYYRQVIAKSRKLSKKRVFFSQKRAFLRIQIRYHFQKLLYILIGTLNDEYEMGLSLVHTIAHRTHSSDFLKKLHISMRNDFLKFRDIRARPRDVVR